MRKSLSPGGSRAILLAACTTLAACGGGAGGDGGAASQAPAHVPINTAGWADSPYVSRDGKHLYFMYSRWNFMPMFVGAQPLLLGPDRPGLHQSLTNPFDESDIFVAIRKADGSWGEATALAFNWAGGDASGMISGNSFYYARSPGGGANPDIFVTTMDGGGNWSAPTSLSPALNTTSIEDNPHVSPTEDGIWFSSDRSGGHGGKDLYFSLRANGVWTAPVNLGPGINTAADEDQPWVDPLGTGWLYFNRGGKIYRSQLINGSFGTPDEFVITGIPAGATVAEISFTDDGRYAYFACGDPASQRIRIMYIVRQNDGSWGPATPVD